MVPFIIIYSAIPLVLSVANLKASEHYKATADTRLQPSQLQLDTSENGSDDDDIRLNFSGETSS